MPHKQGMGKNKVILATERRSVNAAIVGYSSTLCVRGASVLEVPVKNPRSVLTVCKAILAYGASVDMRLLIVQQVLAIPWGTLVQRRKPWWGKSKGLRVQRLSTQTIADFQ